MYGASGTDEALDESAPLRPLTAYAESKVRAEEGLFALAGPDFAPVSMRNATVFGVSPRLRLDIVLNNLAAWAHTTGPHPAPERRHRVAAARPRARRREGGTRAARRARGACPRRGVQRRHRRAELPRPRARGDPVATSPAAPSRSPRARRRTIAPTASTSRSSARPSPSLSLRLGRGARRAGARRCLSGPSA